MLIKRRTLLGSLGGLAVGRMFADSIGAAEAAGNDTIIVAVLLAGGNDGLNTVVPLKQYGSYAKLRTPAPPPVGLALAYSQAALQPLAFDGAPSVAAADATEYAFAPGMTAMRQLYASGKLAVVAGVGLPAQEQNPLSHANAQMDWLTGQINVDGTPPAGWLGLTLDKVAGGALGATASLAGTTPLLTTARKQPLVISAPMDYFGQSYGTTDNWAALTEAYRKIGVLPAASAAGLFDQGVMQAALADVKTVQRLAKAVPAKAYPLTSWLDYQLRDIARLIVGRAGVRGYLAVQGSYDTHASQAQTQPLLLQQLSDSLAAFQTFLTAHGASANVVTMTMSDFGRRPAANLDFGTDHGGATVSFVLGDRVQGGVYGTYPSLNRFDANGNLRLGIDFRNVLSDLIGAMGGNATTVLGQNWPKLGFV